MFKKSLSFPMILFVIVVLILSACAPQAAPTPTAVSQPAATVTSLPAATATSQPTATATFAPVTTETPAAPTAAEAPARFEGLSSGLDNATQARIRTVSLVMGAPLTDVYVNGMPAFNGGMAQQNISAGRFSGWLYVTPGTYTIALVPYGGTKGQPLFPPTEVKVEAGHRYTVASMGQLADNDVHPLVVDETTLEADLGAGVTDNITIDFNNVTGVDSITELAYGEIKAEKIKYGEARAWFCASGSPLFELMVNIGTTTQKVYEDTGFAEPGTSFGLPWFGPFPASNYDQVGNVSQGTSELNVLDFLKGFDGRDVKIDGRLATFNTLLAAIDKAGLGDQLVNSGPYFLMAPTDEVFAAMPQAELDTLLNDPQALMNLLNAHIVDGYYPSGSLSGAIYGHADRTIQNRLGNDLVFYEDSLNDLPIGPNYTVGNGNRVQIITFLLPYK